MLTMKLVRKIYREVNKIYAEDYGVSGCTARAGVRAYVRRNATTLAATYGRDGVSPKVQRIIDAMRSAPARRAG